MSIDVDSLKKTMRKWASGVTIVTAASGERRAGLTASSFTSVALEPPLVLVSIQHYVATFKLIEASGAFGISMLKVNQSHLSRQFAGAVELPEGEDKYYQVETFTAVTGSPLLRDSAAWMDCRLSAIYEAGDSRIVVGEVVATGQDDEAMPLLYHNRAYYRLTPQE